MDDPPKVVKAVVRSPRHAVAALAAVLALFAVAMLGVYAATRSGSAAGTTGSSATATPVSQDEACSRVAGGFVAVFADRRSSDIEWRRALATWVTPAIAAQLDTIDRARVPVLTPTGAKVDAQPGSCDVLVSLRQGGALAVEVEDTAVGWRVSSWGTP